MRSYVFFIAAILFFAQNSCLLAQAKEVNETEVKAAFIKYLESPWSKRADLMTPSSWNDYVGDMLYAYKDAATALLIEYKIKTISFRKCQPTTKICQKEMPSSQHPRFDKNLCLIFQLNLEKTSASFSTSSTNKRTPRQPAFALLT